jgi:MFS family permease
MSRNWDLPWDEYVETLKPHERPMLPGSPATPEHPARLRAAYAGIGVLVTLTGGLGNAMVSANVQNLAGELGITTTEAAWLPVIFVMTNACMNLLLIKFRQQYGLRLFTEIILTVFVATAIAHLFVNDFGSALSVRAVAGMCGAGLSTLGILYLVQAFPAAHRLKGLVIGIGLSSFTAPVARIVGTDLFDIDGWHGFHLMELGLALASLSAVFSLKLPPSERIKVFEKLDFVTFALFAPGIALLCAVLGLGRIVWWTDAPWIGWALAGSIILLAAALIIEHGRERPLLNLRWMANADIVRLALSILLVRIVLSEQTSGAVGFLQQMGLGPDQLHGLFLPILFGTIAGTLVSAFTLNVTRLYLPISIALALIAVGAFMDSDATSLTRPANLVLSQSLLAFASALFIGPALMIGIVQVIEKGAQNLVSFIVIFGVGQNVGGLAGSAIVGTVETLRFREHFANLSQSITLGDPNVVLRLQQLGGAYARTLGDAHLREVEGMRLLQQQITQQAHVLAYNDIFQWIALAALIGAVWVAIVHAKDFFRQRRAAEGASIEAAAQAIE